MADNEDNPNHDMSLEEQQAQYAYGQSVAAAMTNPAIDQSTLSNTAIAAGMDLIYGEHHDAMAATFGEIKRAIESAPTGGVKGVVLEASPEAQYIFDPQTFHTLSKEDFIQAYVDAENENIKAEAAILLEEGIINEDQYNYVTEEVENINSFDPSHEGVLAHYGSIYDAAKAAIDRDIPVVAADVNRARVMSVILGTADDPELHMNDEDAAWLFLEGLDDRSDVELLENFGIDIHGEGSLIVHRGLAHIDDYAGKFGFDVDGFDDVLEENGRHVVTFSVTPTDADADIIELMADPIDPVDFAINVDPEDGPGLDRSEYAPFTAYVGDPDLMREAMDAGVGVDPSEIPSEPDINVQPDTPQYGDPDFTAPGIK